MPISLIRASRHVEQQVAKLASSRQRSIWPKYLYHACDVRTAVHVVRDGVLKCREDAKGFIDVANQGALQIYDGAHSCARFYFRPKNGFHFRTEGIKCVDDPYRLENHMSVPAMFIFDFISVITLESAKFSSGNIQKSRIFLDGDDAFDGLDFEAMYHDSALLSNKDYVINMRMSEVSVGREVSLARHLRAILFRTESDLRTFEYMLKDNIKFRSYRTGTEKIKGSLFLSRGLYINDISFLNGSLNMTFSFPSNFSPPDRKYYVFAEQKVHGSTMIYDKKIELKSPTLNISNYSPQDGIWTVALEKQLAFCGPLKNEISSIF